MSVDVRPVDDGAAAFRPAESGRSGGALIVAWQHPRSRLISPVGRLEHGRGPGYRFRYLRSALTIDGFQPFLSFPDWEQDYRSDELFALFAQRIMNPRRPDYSEYLRRLHLDVNASPWEQLERSEGRRHGDTVQVFPIPVVRHDRVSECCFLVHGVRHINRGILPPLRPGQELDFRAEPSNPVNGDAQLVRTANGTDLGYVPDLLLEHLDALLVSGPVSARVEHVNGTNAPPHLRLLVRLRGTVPPGYLPMHAGRWRPFADENDQPAS